MRRAEHVPRIGEITNAYKILVRKSDGKKPLDRSRRRWEDNIRMDVREIGWKCVDWMHLVEDRDQWWALVKTVISVRVP
jgi:hypothetical protein